MQLSVHRESTCIKAYRRFQILHSVKRPLYNKQSFTESGVCQLENIVTDKDRQTVCFTSTAYLSVIIQIQNIFLMQSLQG